MVVEDCEVVMVSAALSATSISRDVARAAVVTRLSKVNPGK
jgi:hypothetical protein